MPCWFYGVIFTGLHLRIEQVEPAKMSACDDVFAIRPRNENTSGWNNYNITWDPNNNP